MAAGRHAAILAGLWLVSAPTFATSSAAQGVIREPPGPYVIDLRGVTLGMPSAASFYPPLPETVQVPIRAFGVEAGAHVYLARIGPGRLGLGGSLVLVRGQAHLVSNTARIVAPQVSINFGSSRGWSYISGGVGVAQIGSRYAGVEGEVHHSSGVLTAVNVGGGARWFFTPHVAIGFDLRMHRLGAGDPSDGGPGTPSTTLGSAMVGFSVK